MSQRPNNNRKQAESLVPRRPQDIISLEQATLLVGHLTAIRDEYLQLLGQFPPGHPTIRAELSQYSDLTIQNLDRLLGNARRLLTSIRSYGGGPVGREIARDDYILHGQTDRQYQRLREQLNDLEEKLEQEQYEHLRLPRRQQPGHSRPIGPAQQSLRPTPSPPQYQPRPSRPMSPQPTHPFHRRAPSYQDLLEENRELRDEVRMLNDHVRRQERQIERLLDHMEREREEEKEEEEEVEDDEGEGRERKRRKF
jgi:hypothetical protein